MEWIANAGWSDAADVCGAAFMLVMYLLWKGD